MKAKIWDGSIGEKRYQVGDFWDITCTSYEQMKYLYIYIDFMILDFIKCLAL